MRFPLFTVPAPEMIGRAGAFDRMLANLIKPTPQHLSLVGPRYMGKSVLLAALAKRIRAEGAFECVVEWDLGHQTPENDEAFLDRLREKVCGGLLAAGNDLGEFLRADGATHGELREVVETLETEGKRLLMFWDGFDRPLRSGKLTRNLWDNLLELCRQDPFVLVTASRNKLHELILDEASVTSEFWQVFEVVPLPVFDGDDLAAFEAALSGHTFEPGAMKEVANWSGGIPALVISLLNRIVDETPSGSVNQGAVDRAGKESDEQSNGILDQVWSDCPVQAQELFQRVSEIGDCPVSDAGKAERRHLIERGLLAEEKGKLRPACRLLQQRVEGEKPSAGMLGRLFGTPGDYRSNIRGVLEHRLAQVRRFDESLFHKVERSIEEIPDHPEDCLNNLTHVADRALDLVWKKEAETSGRLPQKVIDAWTAPSLTSNTVRLIQEMTSSDTWTVPRERYQQLTLLQCLTGSHQAFNQPLAKYVSKDTYVLLNAIQGFRNRSQHSGGLDVPVGIAVSAMTLCVELLVCLSAELRAEFTAR